MEYNPDTKTISFKSSPYNFGKERENKHYTMRLVSIDDMSILMDEYVDYIEIQCSNSRDKITREVIDITTVCEMLGQFLVGIGWKAPEEVV